MNESFEVKSIQYDLTHIKGGLLTPLNPSTATIQGRFVNVELSSDIVHIFDPLPGNITKASSNDGTVINIDHLPPPIEEKKSKRGRKKKEKQKTKRCKNGKFGSMIQFEVKSVYKLNKIYKIKAFNKETFQVPGVLEPQFGDVMPALHELAKYLEYQLGSDPVTVTDIRPLMRNYTCRIANSNYRINLAAFAKFITHYRSSGSSTYEILEKLRNRKVFRHNNLIQGIEKFLPANRMGIVSIQYDLEKYAGIKIKFRRPLHKIRSHKDELKDITIKIYQSGKINIDGGKEIPEIEELYIWLNDILTKNFDELIIDISKIIIEDDDLLDSTPVLQNIDDDIVHINNHSRVNDIDNDYSEGETDGEIEDDSGYFND